MLTVPNKAPSWGSGNASGGLGVLRAGACSSKWSITRPSVPRFSAVTAKGATGTLAFKRCAPTVSLCKSASSSSALPACTNCKGTCPLPVYPNPSKSAWPCAICACTPSKYCGASSSVIKTNTCAAPYDRALSQTSSPVLAVCHKATGMTCAGKPWVRRSCAARPTSSTIAWPLP